MISSSLSDKKFRTNSVLVNAILPEKERQHRKRGAPHQTRFECTAGQLSVAAEICETENTPLAITLSVYVSLLGSTREKVYLKPYIKDVIRQDFSSSWELVVGSNDDQTLRDFRKQIASSLRQQQANPFLSVRTVLLSVDDGLYETWDLLIEKFSHEFF